MTRIRYEAGEHFSCPYCNKMQSDEIDAYFAPFRDNVVDKCEHCGTPILMNKIGLATYEVLDSRVKS